MSLLPNDEQQQMRRSTLLNSLRTTLTRLRASRSRACRRTRQIERLEDRTLLAAPQPFDLTHLNGTNDLPPNGLDESNRSGFSEDLAGDAVSAAPEISNLSGLQLYREDRPAKLLSPNARVTDADTQVFAGGQLIASILNGEVGDQFEIVTFRGVEAVGTDVRHNGLSVGMISGISGPGGMTIHLNVNAEIASVTAVLNALAFSNSVDDPVAGIREIQFVVTDGAGGSSDPVFQQIEVLPQPDRPVIANLGGPVRFVEGGGPITLAASGTLSDPDKHTEWNGSKLNVRISRNMDSFDRLTIENQGTGPGQIGVVGSDVSYEGTPIGTWNGGVATTRLQTNFHSGTSMAAIQALIRAIQFENLTDLPIVASKDVRFEITDPENFTNLAIPNGLLTVTMQGDNDPASLAGILSTPVTYNEGAGPATIGTGTTLADADYDGGGLIHASILGAEANDRLTLLHQGMGTNQVGVAANQVFFSGVLIGTTSGGIGSNPLQITLNSNATRSGVQAVIRVIQFANVAEDPGSVSRQIRIVFEDGDGSTSDPIFRDVDVNPTNDASEITNYGGDISTTIDTNVRVANLVGVTDVDSPDFAGGIFRATISSGRQTGDVLSLFNDATITVVGSDVFYGGTMIGTLSSNATSLTVLLNGNATATMVQRLGRNLEFSATSAGTRTIRYQVQDGDGGNTTGPDKIIDVS